jgi:phosphoglycolate phosphatase
MEQLKASQSVSIMIGDSGADVGAARAAGVPVILVPDGYTGVPAESLGADYVTGSLADLPGYIVPQRPLLLSA